MFDSQYVEEMTSSLTDVLVAIIGIFFVLCGLFIAFYGLKYVKFICTLIGASVGIILGSNVALMVGDAFPYADTVLSLVFAVLFGAISLKKYKFFGFIFFMGVTGSVSSLVFEGIFGNMDGLPMDPSMVVSILSLCLSIILSYLLCKIFDHAFIIITSLSGTSTVFLGILLIFSEVGGIAAIILCVSCLLLAGLAMRKQFKSNAKEA